MNDVDLHSKPHGLLTRDSNGQLAFFCKVYLQNTLTAYVTTGSIAQYQTSQASKPHELFCIHFSIFMIVSRSNTGERCSNPVKISH